MFSITELTGKKYKTEEAKKSIALLSQGEKDVLEQVRDTLGWPSIVSLAFKYYPAFPHRKWWLEALRRTLKWSHKKNIIYLLKCLQSINAEWSEAAFNGRDGLNRLTHKRKYNNIGYINRLEGPMKLDSFIRRKYGSILWPALGEVVC